MGKDTSISKSKKSLLKFTDFKELDKVKGSDIGKYLCSYNEAIPYLNYLLEITNNEKERAQKKSDALNKIADVLKAIGNNEQADEFRRLDYEQNNTAIKVYLYNWALRNTGFPTVENIAAETNLSRTTIYKHLNKSNYRTIQREKDVALVEGLRDIALENLLKIGISKDNVKALTAFIKFTEPKREVSLKSVTNNNYLTINNFKISQEVIEALPEDKRVEIAALIQKSLPNDKKQ